MIARQQKISCSRLGRGHPYAGFPDPLPNHAIFVSFSLSSHSRLRAAGSEPWPGVGTSLRLANILPVTFAVSGAVASQSAVSAPFSAEAPNVFVIQRKMPPVSL